MKLRPFQLFTAICGWMILSATATALADHVVEVEKPHAEAVEKSTSKFIRVERDDDNDPTSLQTSIVSYQAVKGKVVVDLVGAVHVGDRGYYDELNKRFKNYDVVLYELVAPKDKAIPRGEARNGNPISFLQNMTKSMLDLESQMDHVDYTPDNFVHADMSPEEMQAAMKKRGEDGMTLALGVMADMMRQANLAEQKAKENPDDAVDVNPLALLFDENRPLKMKRMMAESFAGTDDLEGGLGPTMQRMLVDDRNEAAMKVLEKELAKGHKQIAIFYGAAHMPDFEKRLAADFDMKPTKTQWLTAWKMSGSNMGAPAKEDPLKDLLKLLEEATR